MSLQLTSLIIDYAKSLPAWQKILAKAAFQHEGDLSQAKEIDLAISRFLKESNPPLSEKIAGEEEIAFIDSLQASESINNTEIPRLIEISDYQNVNALSDGQKITFAPKLTIVYGENGSGKSGYSRVLNSAFYSRGDKKILPNILRPVSEQGKPTAKFEFEVGSQKSTKLYPVDLGSVEFKQFACFDSKTVPAHLEGANELYVIPKEMEFFDRLAQLIILCEKRLKDGIAKQIKPNEFPKFFEGESPLKTEMSNLGAGTDFSKISAVGLNIDDLKKELQEKEQKFHELKATDSKKIIAELKLAVSECESYSMSLFQALKKCNQDAVNEILGAVERLQAAEANLTKSGAESFETELLKTTGSQNWRQFISSASDFIGGEGEALGREFPERGDSCPLCLQKLEDGAIALFGRYFEFLNGQAEKNTKAEKENIRNLSISYDSSRYSSLSSKNNFIKWLDSNNADDKARLTSVDEAIQVFYEQAKEQLSASDLTPITSVEVQLTELAQLESYKAMIEDSIKTFNDESFTQKLNELNSEVVSLKHKIKFLDMSGDIEKYIKAQKWAAGATAVVKNINTRAITDKQKKVFDEYFTKQYRQVFFREAQKLHVNFQVDVIPKGSVGKSLRKLDVLSYSPAEVLSEGEQRAIALADFLTEIEICNLKGGIVFDDPVNSLDHERKSYIAKRLIEESHRRQVVVFTHDISFLFDLVNEATHQKLKEKEDFFCHWISKIDDNPGVVSLGLRKDLELDYKTVARAEEFWQKARAESAPDARERLCQQGFDALRKTYEAFILTECFGNAVKRFDRQIGYAALKEIYCPRETADFVYGKLSYCSGFVSSHLHADGYSGPVASPEMLKKEIDEFTEFRGKYKDRKQAEKRSALNDQSFVSV